ncbi:MAG: metallophosphoesterase [Oscillospiraceae bacterium]|nr:metallophosphoesterase [Oscillospiraceae bacterium]
MKINNPPKKKKHKGLAVTGAILLLTAAVFLDSRFRIVDTEYSLYYENLPQSFDGYRVVQLSDLHTAQFGEDNDKLINDVTEQNPDIIVITGDLLVRHMEKTNGEQTQAMKPLLEELTEIAPCYFVSGNHEWASGEISELTALLEQLNIIYLKNEFVIIEKGGESIVLAGVEDPNGPADMMKPDELAGIISRNYPDKYIMLLAHRNNWLEKYPDLPVDTILCGHAHGGIVRLPLVGGILGTEMDFLPKYDAGVFNEGNYDLVVSRGLGGQIPRFLNNPELVTVVLKKS